MSAAQTADLSNAPASDFNYTGAGSVSVTVTCTQEGAQPTLDQFSCLATDGVGDNGHGDTVTVTGGSWTDTGMVWTGPDVPSGNYSTTPQTGTLAGY
jgi:hypothetical protein